MDTMKTVKAVPALLIICPSCETKLVTELRVTLSNPLDCLMCGCMFRLDLENVFPIIRTLDIRILDG